MKEITFSFYKGVKLGDILMVRYSVEMNGYHKDRLKVKEDTWEYITKKIADQVKWIKGFINFVLGFDHIDWYESCNEYEVPYFSCSTEGKRLKKGYNTYNDIPKDWTTEYVLKMEIPSSIKGLNKFFEALNLVFTNAQLNDIKKALKSQKPLRISLED